MRKRERKIEDIKSVNEFYNALKGIVVNTFNSYDNGKFFDGWTEEQKKLLYGFGTHILSNVYEPIRKRYTKQERKKYEKILNDCNEFLGQYQKQVKDLQLQLAHQKEMWNELKEWLNKEADHVRYTPYDCRSLSSDFELWHLNKILDKMQELDEEYK